jgi:hypothetical protein
LTAAQPRLVGMEISFRKAPGESDERAWDVLADGAIIGRVERRWQVGRNLVRSYLYSGSGRYVGLWEGTVAHVGLDEDERRFVQREIKRPKRTRETAARHIVEAYEKAGVPLPEAPAGEARAERAARNAKRIAAEALVPLSADPLNVSMLVATRRRERP